MENSKTRKEIMFIPIISAILIVIVGKLNINWYFKNLMFPFIMIIIANTILIMNKKDINKKAYIMLIPIILIIFSNLILLGLKSHLDWTNELLNLIILPILISIYLFLLINKNYKISLNNILLMFKLFPNGLFKNLIFMKIDIPKKKNEKIINITLGILIGLLFASIILFLLSSADDYFNSFLSKIMTNIHVNFNMWIIIKFFIFFIILFTIGINLFKCKDLNMKKNKIKFIDKTIIITMLSVINFAFILFLVSEISKLCGNFLNIPNGYIYSSYAREGFFQLLFVTLIDFSIILYLIYKTNLVKENKIIKILLLLLIIFQILLIFNSYYRMFLYIEKYGFTNLRIQVILFLFMELLLFGVIVKKILKSIKNDSLIFLIIICTTYILNLYMCSDWFIKIINW